jgi:biotin-(acetyl-CoA carboxylase) ligase
VTNLQELVVTDLQETGRDRFTRNWSRQIYKKLAATDLQETGRDRFTRNWSRQVYKKLVATDLREIGRDRLGENNVKCPEDTNKIPTYPSQVRW